MKRYCTFSEAIREGAKLAPQIFDILATAKGTCAIGAGGHAIFESMQMWSINLYDYMRDEYPYLYEVVPTCPVSECSYPGNGRNLENTIIHLNDYHKLSREDIADWLSLEEEKLGYVIISEEEKSKCEKSTFTPALTAPLNSQIPKTTQFAPSALPKR